VKVFALHSMSALSPVPSSETLAVTTSLDAVILQAVNRGSVPGSSAIVASVGRCFRCYVSDVMFRSEARGICFNMSVLPQLVYRMS
jgi:hypothetical protein